MSGPSDHGEEFEWYVNGDVPDEQDRCQRVRKCAILTPMSVSVRLSLAARNWQPIGNSRFRKGTEEAMRTRANQEAGRLADMHNGCSQAHSGSVRMACS